MPEQNENKQNNLSGLNSDAGSEDKSRVLAKLINPRGFARGDFLVVQGAASGTVVKFVQITDANKSDKGRNHQKGTFFYIDNYPVDPRITNNSTLVNRPMFREKMGAIPILTEKDNIDEVATIPPKPLERSIQEIMGAIFNGLKETKQCVKSPINLKSALKQAKGLTGGGSPGKAYRALPPNGKVIHRKDGRKVFSGSHMLYDEDGGVTLSGNNTGIVVDKDGIINLEGKVIYKEAGNSQPNGMGGIPSNKNLLKDFQPSTIVLPMGLGPLALDRIPDFSIVNWVLKLMQGVEVMIELGKNIDEAINGKGSRRLDKAKDKIKDKIK